MLIQQKNENDLKSALQVIYRMFYTLIDDYGDPEELEVELQKIDILKESKEYNKKLDDLHTAENRDLFLLTLENLLDSFYSDIEGEERITESQLDLYIKTLYESKQRKYDNIEHLSWKQIAELYAEKEFENRIKSVNQ